MTRYEPCASGCGCEEFTKCFCADCAISPTFDVEAMARWHAELEAAGIRGLTPEQEARAFDAARELRAPVS